MEHSSESKPIKTRHSFTLYHSFIHSFIKSHSFAKPWIEPGSHTHSLIDTHSFTTLSHRPISFGQPYTFHPSSHSFIKHSASFCTLQKQSLKPGLGGRLCDCGGMLRTFRKVSYLDPKLPSLVPTLIVLQPFKRLSLRPFHSSIISPLFPNSWRLSSESGYLEWSSEDDSASSRARSHPSLDCSSPWTRPIKRPSHPLPLPHLASYHQQAHLWIDCQGL
jgi:hypothetical protein